MSNALEINKHIVLCTSFVVLTVSFCFQEGSIGSDMVIRPLPARLHPVANVTTAPSQNTTVNETAAEETDVHEASDDEMFLDADGELSSEVAIDTGLPIKRKGQDGTEAESRGHKHIIYKRKGQEEDTMSDYGEFMLYIVYF